MCEIADDVWACGRMGWDGMGSKVDVVRLSDELDRWMDGWIDG